MEPMTPMEAHKARASRMQDFVIQAVNEFISAKFDGREVIIEREELIQRIIGITRQENYCITRQEIFDSHWLDIEPLYRSIGWVVEYDAPGYDENYEPYYRFATKKN